MLSLTELDTRRIRHTEHVRYHDFTRLTDVHGRQATVVFTRALLVIRDRAPMGDAQLSRLLELIDAQLAVTTRRIYGRHISVFPKERAVHGLPIPLHPAADEHYRRAGVLPDIVGILGRSASVWLFLALATLLRYGTLPAPLTTADIWLEERLGNLWPAGKFLASSPIMLSFWTLMALLLTNVLVMVWFEAMHSAREGVDNAFAGQTVLEMLTWLVTVAGTSINVELYPNSFQGRIAAAMIPFFGFLYAIVLVAYGFIQKVHRDDLRTRGVHPPGLKNHVIICGWNRRVPDIIHEITTTRAWRRSRKALVIAEHEDDRPLARYSFRPHTLQQPGGPRLRHLNLTGKTYDEALQVLRNHNLLLLAVHRRINDGIEPEPTELDFRSSASPYLVNPNADDPRRHRLVLSCRP